MNLSEPNPASVLFRVWFRQVYTALFYSGFGSDRIRFIQGSVQTGSVLFRVWFRQVYTGFCFIQGLVQTGLYRVLFYSGLDSDRFIQDSVLFKVRFRQVYTGSILFRVRFRQVYTGSVLFRVRFRQVYTGFCFIQGSVQTGLYRILFYSEFGSYRFIRTEP
jgi:hypothetical protein